MNSRQTLLCALDDATVLSAAAHLPAVDLARSLPVMFGSEWFEWEHRHWQELQQLWRQLAAQYGVPVASEEEGKLLEVDWREISIKLHTWQKLEDKDCLSYGYCANCDTTGAWEMARHANCVPPLHVRRFGQHELEKPYRRALYNYAPVYTAEEIVGSYLGNNPNFPSQDNFNVAIDAEDVLDVASETADVILENAKADYKHRIISKFEKAAINELAADCVVKLVRELDHGVYDGFVAEANDLFSDLFQTRLWNRHKKANSLIEHMRTTATQDHNNALGDLMFGDLSKELSAYSVGIRRQDIDRMTFGSLYKHLKEYVDNDRIYKYSDWNWNIPDDTKINMVFVAWH